jgi:hypothetical protein
MMHTKEIAVLALVYRTLWREHYSGSVCLLEDIEGYPEGISFAGMIASQRIEPIDWFIVQLMDHEQLSKPVALSLLEVDRYRAEAALHAWPTDTNVRDDMDDPTWLDVLARWDDVERYIGELAPIAWTTEQVDDVARWAAAELSG